MTIATAALIIFPVFSLLIALAILVRKPPPPPPEAPAVADFLIKAAIIDNIPGMTLRATIASPMPAKRPFQCSTHHLIASTIPPMTAFNFSILAVASGVSAVNDFMKASNLGA